MDVLQLAKIALITNRWDQELLLEDRIGPSNMTMTSDIVAVIQPLNTYHSTPGGVSQLITHSILSEAEIYSAKRKRRMSKNVAKFSLHNTNALKIANFQYCVLRNFSRF